jgi:stage IV sporulation protein FB
MVTDFQTLTHSSTIREAIDKSLACTQQDFPVIHGGTISGVLSRNSLLRALAVEGPDAYVVGVMEREFLSLAPDLDLSTVLPMMAQTSGSAMVLQGERLVGLLTSDNLSHFLALRRFGMDPRDHRA